MSVIDKVLQGDPVEPRTLTLREAAAVVLVGAVTCDGAMAAEEGMRLNSLLSSMRLYREVAPQHVEHIVRKAVELVGRQGAEGVLPWCAAAIPPELQASVFALAVELVFVDGRVSEREKRFVDALQAALHIDDETAMKIVEVLLIRGRV
jgi:uncharacterized tellurite resistance protein B-like protein